MSSDELELLVKRRGFESKEEYTKLISEVDISASSVYIAFKAWRIGDGTKQGLLTLPKKRLNTCQLDTQNMQPQK